MTDEDQRTLKRLGFKRSPVHTLRWVRDVRDVDATLWVQATVEWKDGQWRLHYWRSATGTGREADVLNGLHPTLYLLLMHAEIDGVFEVKG